LKLLILLIKSLPLKGEQNDRTAANALVKAAMEERADNNKPEGWRSPREVSSPTKKNSALGLYQLYALQSFGLLCDLGSSRIMIPIPRTASNDGKENKDISPPPKSDLFGTGEERST